jgi:hypothetical protein
MKDTKKKTVLRKKKTERRMEDGKALGKGKYMLPTGRVIRTYSASDSARGPDDYRMMGVTYHPGSFIGMESGPTEVTGKWNWKDELSELMIQVQDVISDLVALMDNPTEADIWESEISDLEKAVSKNRDSWDKIQRVELKLKELRKERGRRRARITRAKNKVKRARQEVERAAQPSDYRWFFTSCLYDSWEVSQKKFPELQSWVQGVIQMPGGYAFIRIRVQEVNQKEDGFDGTGIDTFGRRYWIPEDIRKKIQLTSGGIRWGQTESDEAVLAIANAKDRKRWSKHLGYFNL